MDVKLSIDEQEGVWMERRRKLEALTRDDWSQRQHDSAQPDPLLFSVAKEGDVDKFIKALEDHCTKERVSLPVLLERRSPSKNTLLHAAAESDDNFRAVIPFSPEYLIYFENSKGETPLHIAARAGKAVAVELLLRQGVPIEPDHCRNSALHEAVRNGHRKVIDHLVSKNPTLLYRQNKESKSPLCVAVEKRDLEVLKVLLEALNDGEDWRTSESQRISGMSPVHVAIIHEEKDMLTMMWEKKPWLFHLRDTRGRTPLHFASFKNYLDGVKFLIEKFPTSALEQDSTDYLPIHVACAMDHVRIVEELLQQWPDPAEFPNGLGQNILHVSARHGSIATVKNILKSPKFDHLINARDVMGNTPLHLAALYYQPSVVLLARDRRVDVNLVNDKNMTALDVVEDDMELFDAAFKKVYSEITNTWALVAALVTSVTFTSGFSVPGGYNGSEGDAGIPMLIHKAMYNVFVTCNSIAMYSSIMALVILLWSCIGDPFFARDAIVLAGLPMSVSLATVLLAFMAGVYVTISELTWLSIILLFLGSVALFITLSLFILLNLPFRCLRHLIRGFNYRIMLWFFP
ncbi:hypothetical protein EUGRSUZ_K00061 [Eucalyptus grandis]|uniref:Uncharacterized protein n=1 Tax=Eucalyptus grandis TaxID=71139 RepID=A0ACC3IRJ2_EUCGR|nr:hypothetical protein EUGRSUZ_K00061 [Eucalyptus grandis]